MAVTITDVKGLGGNPPASIQVSGTSTSCEKVRVSCSCWDKDVEVSVVNGNWSVTQANVKGCACGANIVVNAVCTLGTVASDTYNQALVCGGNCPAVTINTTRAGDCINGKRRVTITVVVNPALSAVQALLLDYGDGTASNAITSAGPFTFQHDYLPNAAGYIVTVSVILPQGCAATTAHVVVDDCQPCCPTLSIQPPRVVDCGANTSSASFQLNVSVPQGCTIPTSFNWTITEQATGRQWFRVAGTSPDTLSGWSLNGNAVGIVDLSAGGNFSVAVVPAGNNAACPMSQATNSFQVSQRCPLITGAMTQSSSDGCTFSFSVPVSNPCKLPVTFIWTFGDGTSATTQVNTAAHTYGAGTNAQQNVAVTIQAQGCQNVGSSIQVTPTCGSTACPPGQHRDANGKCVPDDTTPPPKDMSIPCWILLIIALVLAVVATVLGIIAVCASNPYVGIAAGIVAALAIVFLILWLVLCAAAACKVLLTIIDIVTFIVVVVGPVVGILMAIFGSPLCGLLAAIITSGYWGTLLGILVFAARRIGCLRP